MKAKLSFVQVDEVPDIDLWPGQDLPRPGDLVCFGDPAHNEAFLIRHVVWFMPPDQAPWTEIIIGPIPD